MEKEKNCCCDKKVVIKKCHHGHSSGEALYGLGIFGALAYFLPNTHSFMEVIIGIGKSIFWPAFVVFKILGLLNL